jgi:putative transposase
VIEAFPWDTAPSFLLRDRDASYGSVFSKRVAAMGMTEVVTAPRSPWQNAYVEPVIGSIRRECLDQVIIFNERHLRHVLSSYVDYYHRARTHLSLDLLRSDVVQSAAAGASSRREPSLLPASRRETAPS